MLDVLLVEDNEINALVAQTFLERMGHRVVHAETGEAAVEAAAGAAFDVVLMDISLPGIDGIEAARRIRAARGGAPEIPIVAMSAHVFRSEITAVLEGGMSAFIGKPVSPEQLANVLADVTGGDPVPETAPATEPVALLDPSVLAGDLGVIGTAKVAHMVKVFGHEFPPALARLDGCVRGGDWSGAARAAHHLRGSAASLGLLRIAEEAGQIEEAAHAGDAGAAVAALARLQTVADPSEAALAAEWARLGGEGAAADQRSSISTAKM